MGSRKKTGLIAPPPPPFEPGELAFPLRPGKYKMPTSIKNQPPYVWRQFYTDYGYRMHGRAVIWGWSLWLPLVNKTYRLFERRPDEDYSYARVYIHELTPDFDKRGIAGLKGERLPFDDQSTDALRNAFLLVERQIDPLLRFSYQLSCSTRG